MNHNKKTSLTFGQHLRIILVILKSFNRLGELNRLIGWAENVPTNRRGQWAKRVRRCYINQAETLQGKMPVLKYKYSAQYRVAYGLHCLSNLLNVKPYRRN